MTIKDEQDELRRAKRREYYKRYFAENHERILSNQRKRVKRIRTREQIERERSRRKAAAYRKANRDRILEKYRVAREIDPGIRERTAEHARHYRAKIRCGRHKPKVKRYYIRDKGRRVRGYRMAEVARMIGTSSPTIIGWHETYKMIPEPRFEGCRLYTAAQVELMKQFYSISKNDHDKRSQCSKRIVEDWNK